MSESRIGQLLQAIDKLDVDATMALTAPDVKLQTADGRQAEGSAAVHQLLADFFATLHATTHQIVRQWHPDDVLIAEVQATYELADRTLIGPFPRVFIVTDGPGGFTDLRVYGAHEQPLTDRHDAEHEMRLGGRWIPPL